jgi:hypothetical protein
MMIGSGIPSSHINMPLPTRFLLNPLSWINAARGAAFPVEPGSEPAIEAA